MAQELKTFTVNMKSLDQDIDDPVVVGAGDVNGRTLRIIFTQEAAAQFTPETKVYLKWFHQDRKISGYNVFTHVNYDPPVWEIHYPKSMLYEGNVLCCIEVVDDISIAPSTNFHVHVLADPNDGSSFVVSDDYSVFQQAVIDLASVVEKGQEQLDRQKEEFEDMKRDVDIAKETADAAYNLAVEVSETVNEFVNSSSITASDLTIIEF